MIAVLVYTYTETYRLPPPPPPVLAHLHGYHRFPIYRLNRDLREVAATIFAFICCGMVYRYSLSWEIKAMWKKIALATLALVPLLLAGLLVFFPRTEIRAAHEAVLRQNLFVLRDGLSQYAIDLHRRPQSLAELVTAGYIRQVPVDPMTGRSDTWVIDWSHEPETPGIVGIHSGSRSYSDW